MITLRDVCVAYGRTQVLEDLTWEVDGGCVAVMGPSGSGKSTLLRVIAGLQPPTRGVVRVGGEPVARAGRFSAGDRRVGMVHQDYRLVPFLTGRENLQLAAEVRGLEVSDGDCDSALDRVGLAPILGSRRPGSLSGGEQQRLAIARLLVCRVEVLLADEPTGALDVENTQRVARLLVELGEVPGVTVVVATHDPAVASACRTISRFERGRLTA